MKNKALKRGTRYYLKYTYEAIIRILYTKPKALVDLFLNAKKYCVHDTYFPCYKTKRGLSIFIEQFRTVLRFSQINEFYFPYGFDVKDSSEMGKYLHYAEFMEIRDTYNLQNRHNATFLLRNKFYFGIFTKTYGVDSGKNLALISNHKCYNIQKGKFASLENILEYLPAGDYFVKLVYGECGCGIFQLCKKDSAIYINNKLSDVSQIKSLISSGQFLVQGRIKQHTHMAALHKESINSIRLITVRNVNTGTISVFPSILRIGTGASVVDNTSQGGLAVGIDMNSGLLYEFGFYKPQFGTKVSEHPDTGIIFKDYKIPFFEEAKAQAIMLHSMLPDVYSIGWDVAIGDAGPVFIEGNDNWEINGPQICHGGLKRDFRELLGI